MNADPPSDDLECRLFDEALDLPAGVERDAWLAGACRGDEPLRQRLQALLRVQVEESQFLPERLTTIVTPPAEQPGANIGPYKLREQIGEGGFGTVWVADQESPMKRRVALKVIKLGMDTKEVIARFEQERQALAMMDHPNIAKVFDAGATATGRPYFVMELVRGVKITEYCDQAFLSTADRLQLFITVCHAVQHAHQKGIIHRDLKPSNILVTQLDGTPVPKVIDFGVAKATQGRLIDQTVYTQFAQMIGTPLYMSPEQAEMSAMDVDTRSDIYSLGVLLYELLTGHTPFDGEELGRRALDEIRRIIREQDPAKPSTRLATMGREELTTAARRRQAEPAKLQNQMRGDLDWIVMKCLEKDRNRRYETANGLAADLLHYLVDEPVTATPPGIAYKLRKFVRRNRGPVFAAAAMLLLIVAGLAASLWQAHRAGQAEALAIQKAEDEARQSAMLKSTLNFFTGSVLAAGRPKGLDGGLGRTVTLRAAIDAAEPSIAIRFDGQPRVEYELRRTMGMTYTYLGEPELAMTQYERAVTLAKKLFGVDSLETVSCMNELTPVYQGLGRSEEALTLNQDLLVRIHTIWGPSHEEAIRCMTNLAVCLEEAGDPDQAHEVGLKALGIVETQSGVSSWLRFSILGQLAVTAVGMGRAEEGQAYAEQALQIARNRREVDHPDSIIAMNNLAGVYERTGNLTEAVSLQENALTFSGEILGDTHPQTLLLMGNLGGLCQRVGRIDEAIDLFEKALRITRDKFWADHPDTLLRMNILAAGYLAAGRIAEAASLAEEALKSMKRELPANHPALLATLQNLSTIYEDSGNVEVALQLLEEAVQRNETKHGKNHSLTTRSMEALGHAALRFGRAQKAIPVFEKLLESRKAKPGPLHPSTLAVMHYLALACTEGGDPKRGLELGEEVLRLRKQVLGDNHTETLTSMSNLGATCSMEGKFERALELADELSKVDIPKPDECDQELISRMNTVATVYMRAGKPEKALKKLERVVELREAARGRNDAQTLNSKANLGRVYAAVGKIGKAISMTEETLRGMEAIKMAHPNVYTTMSNLGAFYAENKEFEKAADQLEKTVQLQRSRGMLQGFDGLNALKNLSTVYWDLGKRDKSLETYAEVHQLEKEQHGPEDSRTLHALENLIEMTRRAERWPELPAHYQEYLAIVRKLEPDSLKVANDLAGLGSCLLFQDKFREAEESLRECLALRQKLIPNEWQRFSAALMMGISLMGQEETSQAEPMLDEAWKGLEELAVKIPKSGKLHLKKMFDILIRLTSEPNQAGETSKWKQRLAELQTNNQTAK